MAGAVKAAVLGGGPAEVAAALEEIVAGRCTDAQVPALLRPRPRPRLPALCRTPPCAPSFDVCAARNGCGLGQIGAFLAAGKVRGETPAVVAACAAVLQRVAVPCAVADAYDIVGTGGDGLDTFNVSTCAAVVAAACGVRVAKVRGMRARARVGRD